MAHYHCDVKAGKPGKAAEHAQYIAREGRFTVEKYGEIGEHEAGNLPAWAKGSAARFFARSDDFERSNGSTYREFELALPVELSDAERGRLVREFVAEQIGDKHAYRWAIHEPRGKNPHVHIMYSERTLDGIERDEEQYFKRANTKHPELGGCRKSQAFSGGKTAAQREAALEAFRARWAEVQNLTFERLGLDVRVDHRSLEAQGIEREPGLHRGPAISGIEARGEKAQVTLRREAERALEREAREQAMARQPAAQELVLAMREVSREEVAAERVAARERLELLPQARGELREELLAQVEVDRRERLLRLSAQAERRIERRRELSMAAKLKEKLLTQARALRARLGKELERVKEWVAERVIEPLEKIKERTRGMFEGLTLNTPSASQGVAIERGAKTEKALDRALEGYARAWGDVASMHEQKMPVLAHQKVALKERRQALEKLWPEAGADIRQAVLHEPGAYQAMREFKGRERTQAMRGMLAHEQEVRADPNLRAARVLSVWNGLEKEYEATKRDWDKAAEHKQVKGAMQEWVRELKADREVESVLKQQQKEFGIERGSRLERVINEKQLQRALEMSIWDRSRSHDYGMER